MNEETNYEFTDDVGEQKIDLVLPSKNKKSKSDKGIKIFCIAVAFTVLLSCFSIGGYYLGRFHSLNNASKNSNDSDVNVVLEKKPDDGNEFAVAQIYKDVSPLVVGILVYNDDGDTSEASGVVYSSGGYIVTNDHIYSEVPSAKFKIFFADGKVYNAHYVAGDTRSDLAVLKINEDVELPITKFGDSSEVISGERVCAIGCPNGYNKKSTITTGVVSSPKVRASISSSYSSNFIQTDTAINPGNSGGALVNAYGQIIGITSSKIAGTVYEGIGFAIPSHTVKNIVESLIENGKVVDRARLGISYNFYDSAIAEISGISKGGLYVREVSNDSNLLGKLEVNDIIIRVNDIAITDDAIILDFLEECKPGDEIMLTVYKSNGNTTNLTAKLLSDEGSSSYVNGNSQDKEPGNNGEFNWPEGY